MNTTVIEKVSENSRNIYIFFLLKITSISLSSLKSIKYNLNVYLHKNVPLSDHFLKLVFSFVYVVHLHSTFQPTNSNVALNLHSIECVAWNQTDTSSAAVL